jgi:hypothetical protein
MMSKFMMTVGVSIELGRKWMKRVVSKLEITALNLPKWLNKTTSNLVSFLAAIQVGRLPYTNQKH